MTDLNKTNVSERAMLVSLKFKHWSGGKIDKEITDEVNAQHNAHPDASNVRKFLVDKKSLKAINSARSQIRAFHSTNTLPWSNDGSRILPIEQYWIYRERMTGLIATHDQAVESFIINRYPQEMQNARVRLGTMFSADEYPTVDELRDMYSAKFELWPLPESTDFRCALTDEETAKVRNDMDEAVTERLHETTADLWMRLRKVVTRAVKTLNDPNATFRDSMFDNIKELIELMPNLNLTDDADLTAITDEISATLMAIDPDSLRVTKSTPDNEKAGTLVERKKAATTADDILKKMSAYTGS